MSDYKIKVGDVLICNNLHDIGEVTVVDEDKQFAWLEKTDYVDKSDVLCTFEELRRLNPDKFTERKTQFVPDISFKNLLNLIEKARDEEDCKPEICMFPEAHAKSKYPNDTHGSLREECCENCRIARTLIKEGYATKNDTALEIYKLLWEFEIKYLKNGEAEAANAIMEIRKTIKSKYPERKDKNG